MTYEQLYGGEEYMKYEDYLLLSKIELVIASICIVTSSLLLIVNSINNCLTGRQFLLIPLLQGVAFVLIVAALVTELIRYVKQKRK